VRDLGLDIPPQPTLYVVGSSPGLVALIRISDRVRPDLSAILKTIRAADPDLVVEGAGPLTDAVAGSLAQRKFVLWLLATFAALAAALAAIGIYGVMAYSVASRTREFGIRSALGARPADLSAMLMGQSLRLSLAGIIAGGAASLAALRMIRTLLYRVSAEDPGSYVAVALALIALTVGSSLIPALRALRVNPAEALRITGS
jgi:putative ABC transport system permease protein